MIAGFERNSEHYMQTAAFMPKILYF